MLIPGHLRTRTTATRAPLPWGAPRRASMDEDKQTRLLEGLAQMVESMRDHGMTRSKPTMAVAEHKRILTIVAANVRKGLVAL